MNIQGCDGTESGSVGKVLRLLGALKQSQTGNIIYRQVQMLLDDMVLSHQSSERAYLTAINQLLDAFLLHLHDGAPLKLQVRMLQARLQLPMTASDLQALRDYNDLYARHIESMHSMDTELFRNAIAPLLEFFGITEPDSANIPSEKAAIEKQAQAQASWKTEKREETPSSDWPLVDKTEPESVTDKEEETLSHHLPVDEAAATESEAKESGRASTIQSGLAQQVLETIEQNREFSLLLETVQENIYKAGNRKELEDMRWGLIREIETLRKAHNKLNENLGDAQEYINKIEADSQQLTDELRRARLLSVTDELTDLPNRRAFLQRLEDEVARVQRYNSPLSMALIDIDFFKKVNDEYGHPGGDEVLKLYSRNILSIFRHHDLVARYGGEEFAVLMPNTEIDGAVRALEKVLHHAHESYWQCEGKKILAPTFSAGVAFYKSGETASAFIERSDKALYRAKNRGRNRIEVDNSYSSSSDTDQESSD